MIWRKESALNSLWDFTAKDDKRSLIDLLTTYRQRLKQTQYIATPGTPSTLREAWSQPYGRMQSMPP